MLILIGFPNHTLIFFVQDSDLVFFFFNVVILTFSENFGSLTLANSPSCFISSGISGLSNVFVKLTSV